MNPAPIVADVGVNAILPAIPAAPPLQRVGAAHLRLRVAEVHNASSCGLAVTTSDLGDHVTFVVACDNANVPGAVVGPPAWAAPLLELPAQVAALQGQVAALQGQVAALQGQVAALQGQVAALQGQVAALQGQVAALQGQVAAVREQLVAQDAAMQALDARILNGTVEAPDDMIVAVVNAAGDAVPAAFPATRRQLTALTGAHANGLLAYYGMPAGGTVAQPSASGAPSRRAQCRRYPVVLIRALERT
ncbi:SAP domain-containing protein [Plasmodiophora brassicae]